MTRNGMEQRQQARLQPASPQMWWTRVGANDVADGVLVDISRGGISFVLPPNIAPPEIGDQINVQFKTPSPRPLVYSVVRQSSRDGAVVLGCCRQLRPGVPVPTRRRPRDLVEVRKMRRQHFAEVEISDAQTDLQLAA